MSPSAWKEWSVRAGEEEAARRVVVQACGQAGIPPPATFTIAQQQSSVLYYLGSRGVIKAFAPNMAAWFENELTAYRILAASDVLPIPRLLAAGSLEPEGWPFLLMTTLRGRPLDDVWIDVSPPQRLSILERLGATLHELHSLPVPDEANLSHEDWNAFVQQNVDSRLVDPQGMLLPPSLEAAACDYIEKTWPILSTRPERSLLHTEINRRHVFVERRGSAWELGGILDFGTARLGDPIFDLVRTAIYFCEMDPGLLAPVLRGYGESFPPEQDFLERWLFYALIHPQRKLRLRLRQHFDSRNLRSLDDLLGSLFGEETRRPVA